MMDLNLTAWRKASHSGTNGGECVEVSATSSTTAIRDSKNPRGPKLLISRQEARALAEHIKNA